MKRGIAAEPRERDRPASQFFRPGFCSKTAAGRTERNGPADRPPFRADHVGSLLRPPALLAAREQAAKGDIARADLRAAEDAAIRDVVALQEGLGLHSVTDGEFRRTYFHIDFLERFEGVSVSGDGIAAHFHREDGDLDFAPPRLAITGKLGGRDRSSARTSPSSPPQRARRPR